MNRLVPLLAGGCLLAGCAVGPDFRAPAAPSVGRYTAQPLASEFGDPGQLGVPLQRVVAGRDIPAEWWQLFRSAPLDALVRRALAANADLEAAQAALRVAQENVRAQRSAFFPTVDAQFNPTRQSVATPLSSPLASGSNIYSLHTAQLTIAYSPDVFGGNRRQVESLQAQAEALRFQKEAVAITLASNLVAGVVQRASLQAQIAASRDIAALAASQLNLVRRQQALGQVGVADVTAQEALLAQFEATLPPLEKQLAQQENQLAVLLGVPPSEAALPDIALADLQLPGELPLSLPSLLVEQRPDVRAAQAQWHAASAQIGVATAARLPNLSLAATTGSAALRVSQLFSAGTGFWALNANLAQPLFDAGGLMHRQRAAEAAAAQAAALYRGTVLGAFQNVADTLNALASDAAALAAQRRAEQAAERSLDVARRQRAAGAVGSLAVLAAQQAYRQAALARVQAEASRLADSVALFQALGGGWWMRVDEAVAGR